MNPEIDTSNRFLVSRTSAADWMRPHEKVVLFRPPLNGERITTDEALVLAAWLVVIADPQMERFAAILERVRGS